MKLKLVLAACFIILYASMGVVSVVSAAGIGVSPKSIEVNQNADSAAKTHLFIYNTGDKAVDFSLQADKLPRLINMDPDQFLLGSRQSKTVELEFKNIPPGDYATFVSIVGKELDAQEASPKMGIKVPLEMHIAQEKGWPAMNYSVIVIGLILIALTLWLWSMARYSRMSRTRKAVDSLQETLAAGSVQKTIKHYLKHHRLLIVSLAVLVVALVLLFFSVTADPSAGLERASSVIGQAEAHLEIKTPETSRNFAVPLLPGRAMSVLDALTTASENYGFSLQYDPPIEMGILVTEIDGYKNGAGGKYWVYEVNNEYIPVAADRYFLDPGDYVKWKFDVPQ